MREELRELAAKAKANGRMDAYVVLDAAYRDCETLATMWEECQAAADQVESWYSTVSSAIVAAEQVTQVSPNAHPFLMKLRAITLAAVTGFFGQALAKWQSENLKLRQQIGEL